MKKVIFKEPNLETISAQDLPSDPIIGIKYNTNKKAILIKEDYGSSFYLARCIDGWKDGNMFNPYGKRTNTLDYWFSFFGKDSQTEIFSFDSPQDLFKWLAE
jgi:hypothetical protein